MLNLDSLVDVLADRIAERVAERILAELRASREQRRLVPVAEAARYLGRSTHALRHMIAQGRVPAIRDGRRVLLDQAELDKYVDKNSPSVI